MIGFFHRHRTAILWAITVAVIVTMLPWGVSLFPYGETSPVVGAIDGEDVTLKDLQTLAREAGVRVSEEPAELVPFFWELALARFAERQGVSPPPEAVKQAAERYLQILRQRQPDFDPQGFERRLAQRMTSEILQGLLGTTLSASDLECYELFLREDEERKAKYVRLPASELGFLAGSEPVPDAEIQRFYDAHKDRPAGEKTLGFRLDERVRFECALLVRARIAQETAAVTEEDILKEYEASRDARYKRRSEDAQPATTPLSTDGYLPLSEVRAEILTRLTERRVADKLQETLNRAHGLTSESLSRPQDLLSVSRRFQLNYVDSVGPCSRDELKATSLGDLSQAASALFAAPPGQARTALVADGGILFRVLEQIPATSRPLAEVKDAIAEEIRLARLLEKVREEAEAIRKKAEDSSIELILREKAEAWKLAHNLPESVLAIRSTEFFKLSDASVAGVGGSPEFRRAAFDLPKPKTPEELRRTPGLPEGPRYAVADDYEDKAVFILAATEARAPDPRSFATRKEHLRRILVRQKQGFLLDSFSEWLSRSGFATFTYRTQTQ